MFEWNEDDGLTDTIWGDLIDREDHIVPYPKSSEDDGLFNYHDFENKLRDDKRNSVTRSHEKNASEQKDDCHGSNQGCTVQYSSEVAGSRFCMDAWTSFNSLENSIRKDGDGNDQGSTSTIFNDFTDTPNFNRARDNMFAVGHSGDVENDSGHGQTEVDSFLDCDWASITDFEDLDGIFRNGDSNDRHDELLSPTKSNKDHMLPLHISDMEESHRKEKCPEDDKTAENKSGSCHSQTHATSNHDVPKIIDPKKVLKSRTKDKEKTVSDLRKPANSQSLVNASSKHLEKLSPATSTFYSSAAFRSQIHATEPAYLGYYPSQQMVMGYGYPAPPFPTVPLVQFVPSTNINSDTAWISNVYSGYAKNYNHVQNEQQEASSRALSMTPQEKIEKLRRRQQMQAMLAIKQQEKQFGQKNITTDVVPQLPSPTDTTRLSVINTSITENMVPLSELSVPVEQDESHNISILSDDYSLQETIFSELQETVVKLDHNVRLCMRDSLFRLAKSAAERHGANNCTSLKSIKNENHFAVGHDHHSQEGCFGLMDAETDTNPIDRAVAHLLFHKSPQQPISAVQQLNVCDDNLEGNAEIIRVSKGKAPL